MSNTPIIQGRPPNKDETFIKEKYLESLTQQPALINDVIKQLFTVELAVPGIYIAILKLNHDDKQAIVISDDLYYVFACWLVSFVCILIALIPRSYRVNPDDHTELRESFFRVALYKFTWLVASTTAFVAGLFFAVKDMMS